MAMGARGNFELLNPEDAREVLNQQFKILSEESFEEKQLKQELEKIRMTRLNALIMLQSIAGAECADVANQSKSVANKDRGSEGSGGVALVQPTFLDAIGEAMEKAEVGAMRALQVLAEECTERRFDDSIAREVTSALGLLAKSGRSITASADALLSMGRAVAACPPEQSRDQQRRVQGVENNVRDVAVWRCQMNAGPMDNRHKFKASLQLAFGEEALDDRKTNIFARLMHAHRKEVADHLPTSWKSNSQLTRKRPKRERHTAETK